MNESLAQPLMLFNRELRCKSALSHNKGIKVNMTLSNWKALSKPK